jgi:hypothetical protein
LSQQQEEEQEDLRQREDRQTSSPSSSATASTLQRTWFSVSSWSYSLLLYCVWHAQRFKHSILSSLDPSSLLIVQEHEHCRRTVVLRTCTALCASAATALF